ncbi:MAG: hypothetical protein ABIS47_14880 [Acidimicrobiales bacterium]
MRFAVEPRDPAYGVPVDMEDLVATAAEVAVDIEVEASAWAPCAAAIGAHRPASVLFCDGVRRIDATLWIDEGDGRVRPAMAASVGAGAVRCCGGAAVVIARVVGRCVATASPGAEAVPTRHGTYDLRRTVGDAPAVLNAAVVGAMAELEVAVARDHAVDAELVLVDGRLRRPGGHPPGTVGYVKSHGARYLPEEQEAVIARLAPGQRTPLFRLGQKMGTVISWYLRLPGGRGHPWAGVVRCEVGGDLSTERTAAIADACCLALPSFASAAHKDARAPVNLVPIGGLERDLRHRLGDAQLLYRALLTAAQNP